MPPVANEENAIPTVGESGEFALIARITARLAAPPPPLGPGDDAAVVPAPDGRVVAVMTAITHEILDGLTTIARERGVEAFEFHG